jgi:putative SOS response-associated peptidase YedK
MFVSPGEDVTRLNHTRPWGRGFVSIYWGLLPSWAKEPKGLQPINAQCETAHQKPMLRDLVRSRRCLVAADGFYEWVKTPARKVPPSGQQSHNPPKKIGSPPEWVM